MSRRRKVLLVLACIPAALVVALVIMGLDESPPDDSALIVPRPEIPDDQNGYAFFLQAREAVFWPHSKAWQEMEGFPEEPKTADREWPGLEEAVEEMNDDKAWWPVTASAIVDRNGRTLELVAKALAAPHYQRPKPVGLEAFGADDVGADLNVARVLALRVRVLARDGKDEAALQQAEDLARLGHRIDGSKGYLVTYLVGEAIRSMGCYEIRSLLKKTTVPPERLKVLADRLGECTDSSAALADTLRVEYEWGMSVTDKAVTGHGSGLRDIPGSSLGWLPFMYRPNQTRRLFADFYSQAVASVGKPMSEVDLPDPRDYFRSGWPRIIYRGNFLGYCSYAMMVPAVRGFVRGQKSRMETEGRITRTLVAMKAFKARTGRLPQSLDELVPAYLPAVPLDDFDGKPVRYSAAKKTVYSVGKDLKDEGGMTRQEARDWWQKNKMDPDVPLEDYEDAPEDVPAMNLPDPSYPINF